MSRPRTLIIENDKEDRASLRQTLEDADHAVTVADTGSRALDRLRDSSFDLVITGLDLNDGLTGLQVAQAVKWRWPKSSVIVAADNESFDAVKTAINLGVDGYLLKPIGEAELERTVNRALERREARCCLEESSEVFRWEGLVLDKSKKTVTIKGEPVDLTPTEFAILAYLMENAHRVVPPVELLEAAHGHRPEDQEKANDTVRWHIYNLRQKIEPHPHGPTYILNVYGHGYTFVGPEG